MAAEGTTFGATIERSEPASDPPKRWSSNNPYSKAVDKELRPQPSHITLESATSTPTPIAEYDSSNPFSAFYTHNRSSIEAARPQLLQPSPQASSKQLADGYSTDLEAGPLAPQPEAAGAALSTTTTQQPKVSVDGRVKECTAWPSRATLQEKAKAEKRGRICRPLRRLSKKQRLAAQILIALFVLAAAVGIGVGVSKAVGGGVWSGNGQNKQIGSTR